MRINHKQSDSQSQQVRFIQKSNEKLDIVDALHPEKTCINPKVYKNFVGLVKLALAYTFLFLIFSELGQ